MKTTKISTILVLLLVLMICQAKVKGAIDGSGTANHIPKFTDLNTLGDSAIYETSGNVGIGTMTPEGVLHIRRYGNDSKQLVLGNINQLSSEWFFRVDNSTNFSINREGLTFVPLYIRNDGNVGIGTVSPSAMLEVNGQVKISSDVGIGTMSPTERLDVAGSITAFRYYDRNNTDYYMDPANTVTSAKLAGKVGIGTTSPTQKLDVAGNITASRYYDRNNTDYYMDPSNTGTSAKFRGNVGIGTSSPETKLHISGGSDASLSYGSGYVVTGSYSGKNMVIDDNEIIARNNGNPSKLYLNYGSDNVVVSVLEITGGSDLAEPFEVAGAESIEPGMVVTIDPEHPGQLRIAEKAYDRAVAGIVSGANGVKPGLTMKQEGTVANGSLPVSLSGRVYCWADASYGPIQPGDLLTTSDTKGHVMKVQNYTQAQGAIIGKAMSSVKDGQGLVLVLVTLQ